MICSNSRMVRHSLIKAIHFLEVMNARRPNELIKKMMLDLDLKCLYFRLEMENGKAH